MLGGALTILGGLGTWIRTVQYTVSIGRSAKEGPAVMGHSDLGGWAIAAVGLLALVSAAAWTMKGLLPKLVPVLTALGVAAVAAWRLPILNDHVAAMIEDARRSVGVTGFYHVGFGWGAWLLFAAPFVLIVGVVAGILRDVDQRKGLAG